MTYLLGMLQNLPKATISFFLSVCTSVFRRNIAASTRQIFVDFCIGWPRYNLWTKFNFG